MSARNSFVGLTGDEIFHETDNPPWLLEGMDDSSGNYCWQKQETLKGSMLPGGTMYGGWRFHEWKSGFNPDGFATTNAHYSATQAAAMVSDRSVTNNSVFNRGFDPMFDHDMSQDDQRNHPYFGVNWFHSDMKDMAYFYVYMLYEQLITKGNFK